MPAKSGLLMHSEGSGSSGGLSGVSEMKRDGNPSEDPKSRHTNISAEQAKAFTGYYLFIFCRPIPQSLRHVGNFPIRLQFCPAYYLKEHQHLAELWCSKALKYTFFEGYIPLVITMDGLL